MFIRIPLRPTFIRKQPRAVLINLQHVDRCFLEHKKIEFYPGDRSVFGNTPFVMRYNSHEEAVQRFETIEQLVIPPKIESQKQERWDMPSPDPLALEELK